MSDRSAIQNWQVLFKILEEESGNDVVIRRIEDNVSIDVTAPELFRDIRRTSNAMLKRGLQGKRVFLIGKNSYDWVVMICSMNNIGCVSIPLSADSKADTIAEDARHTDAEVLIYDPELASIVMDDSCSFLERICFTELDETDTSLIDSFVNTKREDDLSCIFFTSGTTGRNKAVMFTNKALIFDVFLEQFPEKHRSILAILPFHHMAGIGNVLASLGNHVIACIGDNIRNIFQCLKLMKPEAVLAVPMLMDIIGRKLQTAKSVEELGWELKVFLCAGAKFQPEFYSIFSDKGIHIWQGYGATETAGRGLMGRMTDDTLNAVGYALDCVQAKIENDELMLCGEGFSYGYYNDEEETRATYTDNWIHTGDLFTVDDNGLYYMKGRKKNLIILSNGENVSPEEIEGILSQSPDIEEILVHEKNDRIAAEIFPAFNNCSEEEKDEIRSRISDYVRQYNETAPTYKQVRIVDFREEPLPRTASGKIIRNLQ